MVKVKQQFFKTAGGSSFDSGNSLSVNCQRVFVTGQISGNTAADFCGITKTLYGTKDAFVAGLDHNGNQKFFKHAGRPWSDSSGISIISNCDETFITGSIAGPTAINFDGIETTVNTTTDGDRRGVFVSGLDNCGKQKFFKTAGNIDVLSTEPQIAQNDGRIFISSQLFGSSIIDFCGIEHSFNLTNKILVAGLDHSGRQKFFSIAGGGNITDNSVNDLTSNCKGVYVTGRIGTGSVDFNNTPIQTRSNGDIFVAGLNNCGKQIFFKNTGTLGNSASRGITITESCSKIYVTGIIQSGNASDFNNKPVSTYGGRDIFVAGLDDTTGNQSFFVTAGGKFNDEGVSIAANEHGVFVTGFVLGSTATNFCGKPVPNLQDNSIGDIFVAGLTKCGTQKFFVTAGSSSFEQGNSITVNDEGIFVTGYINGSTATDFCGNLIPNLQDNGDIFVAKLDFCGHQQYFLTAGGNQLDQGNQIVVRNNEIYVTGRMGGAAGVNFKHCPVTTLKGEGDIFVARLDDLCGQKRSKRSTMPYVPR